MMDVQWSSWHNVPWTVDCYISAATQLPPRPSPPVDVGISISRCVQPPPRRRRCIYQPMVHPPPPPAHPFLLHHSSVAIFSCRHRVREGIETTDDALEDRKQKTAPLYYSHHTYPYPTAQRLIVMAGGDRSVSSSWWTTTTTTLVTEDVASLMRWWRWW